MNNNSMLLSSFVNSVIPTILEEYDYYFPITPIPKPRMTRSDSWKKRPCVVKYYEYKDSLNSMAESLDYIPSVDDFRLYLLPFPQSYSKKKRTSLSLRPHTLKPDIDNLDKAFYDCLYENDSHIWLNNSAKLWQSYLNDNSIGIYIISLERHHNILSNYL